MTYQSIILYSNILDPSQVCIYSMKMCSKEFIWYLYTCYRYIYASYTFELLAVALKPKTCHFQGKYRLVTYLPTILTLLYLTLVNITLNLNSGGYDFEKTRSEVLVWDHYRGQWKLVTKMKLPRYAHVAQTVNYNDFCKWYPTV